MYIYIYIVLVHNLIQAMKIPKNIHYWTNRPTIEENIVIKKYEKYLVLIKSLQRRRGEQN